MKIAFANHTFILGSGIDSLIYQLSKRLSAGNEVSIFTLCSDYTDINGVTIREKDIPFKRNRAIRQLFAPLFTGTWNQIRSELRDYDIVISQIYPANLLTSFPRRLKGPLSVVIEWSTPVHPFARPLEWQYVNLIKQFNGRACRNADRVLVSSNFVKSWVKNEWGIDADKMLLDGVDFSGFDRTKAAPGNVYGRYPLLKGRPVMLYVGQVAPHKNLETLIAALISVRRTVPDAMLLIVGSLTYPDYYNRLVKMLEQRDMEDAVIFTGTVPWEALPDYYAACDVYVTCSLWEGFLRGEAYALAKPMIAFDVTSHADSIIPGETGLLVKEITAEAFADAVAGLLKAKTAREKMGENGYRWARENLDLDVIAVRLEKYLAGLLQERAKKNEG